MSVRNRLTPFTSTFAVLCTIAVAALFVRVEPAAAADDQPCTKSSKYRDLPYNCPVWWPSGGVIPVYGDRDESRLVDWLDRRKSGNIQYFNCELRGATYQAYGYKNNWWALTQGDDGKWGWVPEIYFKGGDDNEPDAGLRLCPSEEGKIP